MILVCLWRRDGRTWENRWSTHLKGHGKTVPGHVPLITIGNCEYCRQGVNYSVTGQLGWDGLQTLSANSYSLFWNQMFTPSKSSPLSSVETSTTLTSGTSCFNTLLFRVRFLHEKHVLQHSVDCVCYLRDNILFCYESISLRWAKDKEETYQFAILNGVSLYPKGLVTHTITAIVVCNGHTPLFDKMEIRFSSESIVVCGYEMGQRRKSHLKPRIRLRVWKHTGRLCQDILLKD